MIFNEQALRREIIDKWGEYGAHLEVFDSILKKNNELQEKLDSICTSNKKNLPVTERIKGFEDIMNEFGKGMDYFEHPELSIRERGLRKCEAICSVLNEGWEADYSNDDQKKWFPVFQYKSGSSSLVFSSSHFEYWLTYTSGGSRLCRLKSKELSDFAGKMFQKEFLEMIG